MKKILLLTLSVAFCASVFAQQIPLTSQYQYNIFVLNPALSGIQVGNQLSLNARRQYMGLDNSIGTVSAAFQTRSIENRAGGGVQFLNDNFGLFRTNSLGASYAYHLPFGDEKQLSFGLGAIGIDNRLDLTKVNITNETDPVVALLLNEGGLAWDANFGVNLKLKKFNIGLASLQTLQNRKTYRNKINEKAFYNLSRHWVMNAGYLANLNENVDINTLLIFRKTKDVAGQIDLSAIFEHKRIGYAGVAYRDGLSVSFLGGVHLSEVLSAGYSFDLTTHKYRNALGNTHEVLLVFRIGKKSAEKEQPTNVIAKENNSEQGNYHELRISQLEAQLDEISTQKSKVDTIVVLKERIVEKSVETSRNTVPSNSTESLHKKNISQNQSNSESTSTEIFHVIAGAFSTNANATAFVNKLKDQGTISRVQYDPKTNNYYVSLAQFESKESAIEKLMTYKNTGLDLWIKSL